MQRKTNTKATVVCVMLVSGVNALSDCGWRSSQNVGYVKLERYLVPQLGFSPSGISRVQPLVK